MWNFFKTKLKKLSGLGSKIKALFSSTKIDEDLLLGFEQLLYEADLGVAVTSILVEELKKEMKKDKESFGSEEALALLKEKLLALLPKEKETTHFSTVPHVILLVGVNGSGKTTTLVKLAHWYQKKHKKKILAVAADTFRAAALEQLAFWAKKVGIELIKSQQGQDPSAVVFDALQAAKARKSDVVLIDIAGRLHTKTLLMEELSKIERVCSKVIANAPHEVLLVVDATTGQNGVDQGIIFQKYAPLTGIVLTKLDGSAKGGLAIALSQKLNLPIVWIGTGETEEDLHSFDPENYIEALLKE